MLEPYQLSYNRDNSFQGVALGGDGFLLSKEKGREILKNNPEYTMVVKDFLIGDDLNNDYLLRPSRKVICFSELEENEAIKYQPLYQKIKETVYPIRKNNKREARRKYWFQFAEKASGLFAKLKERKYFYIAAKTSKYLSIVLHSDNNIIFDQSLTVITIENRN